MDPEHWQQKYNLALARLETEQARWRQLEEILRRLVVRLCLIAHGIDPQLDAPIDRLASAIRRLEGHDELKGILDQLTDTLVAIELAPRTDTPPAPAAASFEPPDAQPGSMLLRLLDRLSLIEALRERADVVRAMLLSAVEPAALHDALGALADLVNAQRQHLEREKDELARIIALVSLRLDEIGRQLVAHEGDADASAQQNDRLQQQMTNELHQLDISARRAADIAELRLQIRGRLDTIERLVQGHVTRERERVGGVRERTSRLRRRIEELEREAHALQESLQREQRMALTDALTGLPNRFAYEDRIAQEYRVWKRTGRPLTLAALDLDHFKAVNDQYGHRAGDKVLRVVAGQLASSLRESDFVARYGGEEFLLILTGADVPAALKVVDGLREKVGALGFHVSHAPVNITLSCGVAGFSGQDTPETAYERADRALYEAKRQGRNRCVPG